MNAIVYFSKVAARHSSYPRVRETMFGRIAIMLPSANQDMAKGILLDCIDFTDRYHEICHLCFDPYHIEAGEIGIELKPGCFWSDIVLEKQDELLLLAQ